MDKEKAQTKIIEISKYTSLITIFMYIDQTCQLKTEISRLDKQNFNYMLCMRDTSKI